MQQGQLGIESQEAGWGLVDGNYLEEITGVGAFWLNGLSRILPEGRPGKQRTLKGDWGMIPLVMRYLVWGIHSNLTQRDSC